MGLTFRTSSSQTQRVNVGKRTVKEGEALCVWRRNGSCEEIIGPRLARFWFANIRFMDPFRAAPGEYLVVKFQSGKIEHLSGPVQLFQHHVLHKSIEVARAVRLQSSTECIVTYREQRDASSSGVAGPRGTGKVARKLIRGPFVFIPEVGETLQSFRWTKKEGAQQFTVLPLGSQRWLVTVPMKTQDKVAVSIDLTIGFRINDLDAMLANTTDLTGELFSSLESDLSAFGAKVASTDEASISRALQGTTNFPLLLERAESTGVTIEEILFRGLHISEQLRQQYEELANKKAEAEQTQLMEDQKLQHERKRAELTQEKDSRQLKHELAIQQTKDNAAKFAEELKNQEELEYLGALAKLGVDLTTYLTFEPKKYEEPKK